jgi:SAM-dependent methyltransferase
MNQNWSNGYVSDLTYSHGYYHELSPSFIRFFLLLNGYANASQGGQYNYCELGYGQGVSANLHAAANPRGRFAGTDFQADHALFARGLAGEAGLDANWMALGFEQLLDEDLPSFDFITLHGVWSWIHAPGRHAIVEFLRRKLKVGGVVFMSYNVMPGWSAEKPLRDLLWMHTEQAGASGASTPARIKGALAFGERLRKGKAAYFEQNPKAGQMLEDMLRDDVHVVAHEYFNRHWHITYFAELAETLEAAGLNFACSLHRSDLLGEVMQRNIQGGMTDLGLSTAMQQITNDFVLNRRFRRDVFVRGAARMPQPQRDAMVRQASLVLMRSASAISATLQTPYGTVTLDATLTSRLARALEAADGPCSIGQLIADADLHSASFERIVETLAAFVAQGHACPVFADDAAAAPQACARTMNRAIGERARYDNTLRYLASPVTGQGHEASRLDRLLLLAWEEGARSPAQLAAGVQVHRAALSDLLDTEAAGARADLEARAAHFIDTVVPLWRRIGLISEVAA